MVEAQVSWMKNTDLHGWGTGLLDKEYWSYGWGTGLMIKEYWSYGWGTGLLNKE